MSTRRVWIEPVRVVLIENDEQDFKREFSLNWPPALASKVFVVGDEPEAMKLARKLWAEGSLLTAVVENLDATNSTARESPLQLLRFLERGQTACGGIAFTSDELIYLYYRERLKPWTVLYRAEPFELFARKLQRIPLFF